MYTKKWVKSRPFTGVSPFLSASSNNLFAISSLRLFSICLYLVPIRRAQIPGGAILSLKSGSLAPLSHFRTITCGLLHSLVALFSTPILYFQSLADSFRKTPGGVWGVALPAAPTERGPLMKRFQPACPPRNFSPRLLRLREAAIIFAPHDEIRLRNGWARSRSARQVRAGHRAGSACPTADQHQDFLRLLHAVWRCAQHQCLPSVPGPAGHASSVEQARRGNGGARFAGVALHSARALALCAQELFLSRPAQGLPNLAI